MRTLWFIACFFYSTLFAAQMTNTITGVGPKGAIKPYICIQNSAGVVSLALAPGASGDANQASGNAYYVGASLRFGGCSYQNSYLGYVGFGLNDAGNNTINNYAPPENVHIAYKNPSIDRAGRVSGAIDYTPIDANFTLTSPRTNDSWQFTGVNLSGLEFGKTIDPFVIPNLSITDTPSPNSDLKDTQAFLDAGMNTVRLPLSWGYLQLDGAGKGTINRAYYDNYVKPLLQTLTHAHVYTIIDLHAYMRYSLFGEQYSGCGMSGNCPDGTLILDESAYQSVWGQLMDIILSDPLIDTDYILVDLMNEPVDVPDDSVFTLQTAVIKTLRDKQFNGYILVEGNHWSGLHSWTTGQWRGQDGQVYTNATLFTRDNFIKAGITDLSKIIINVHQYLDSNYSGTHDDCQQNLNSTGPSGFNLDAFVDYLQTNQLQAMVTEFGTGRNASSCREPLSQFMTYLKEHSSNKKAYGFLGWTIWSTGHGWGDYNLRVKPTSYHMPILEQYTKPL